MTLSTDQTLACDAILETLREMIAHSPIVVEQLTVGQQHGDAGFPEGFDDVDIAILNWIVAEGRRIGRHGLPM